MTSPTKSTEAPTWRSTSIIVKTSAIRGTFVSAVRPWASSEAAMSLRAEFFAPETTTEPESWWPPSTYNDPMKRRFYSCAAPAPRRWHRLRRYGEDERKRVEGLPCREAEDRQARDRAQKWRAPCGPHLVRSGR